MEGLCKLCGAQAKLIHSHVLPAFLFRWLKQAGHIRFSQAPNRRTQDGAKMYWLCRKCEDIFSAWETAFATRIFHPYDRDRAVRVRYSDWLSKFCVSVAWRSLLYLKQEHPLSGLNGTHDTAAENALQTWGKFLRGQYKHVGKFEVHMLPFDLISENRAANFPPNINRYLTRAIEINAGTSEATSFVYSKMGPFAVFGFVKLRYPNQWKGTRVYERGGWFGPTDYTVPRQLADFLSERAARGRQAMERISAAQQEKIASGIRANLDRYVNSGLFRATQRDVEMFGREAFTTYPQAYKSQDGIEE